MGSALAPVIAGVRLAGGRQVFIKGVPEDLEQGTRVALCWADQTHEGTVSVPPRLIVWRDPEAPLGEFLHRISAAPAVPATPTEPPLALFQEDEDAPDAGHQARMLDLARAELHRLDD